MEQILTFTEVVELLKSMPLTDEERALFDDEVIYCIKAVSGVVESREEISLLEKCSYFLQDKGIYVFFKAEEGSIYYFIAGEAGRVYERLLQKLLYINLLLDFIQEYKYLLPFNLDKAKFEKLRSYSATIACDYLPALEIAYGGTDKEQLARLWEKASGFADKIDAFLESMHEVCRYFEIMTQELTEEEAAQYLTKAEVIELLKNETLSEDPRALEIFKKLVENSDEDYFKINDPTIEVPVLERCADFLRRKGIYVIAKPIAWAGGIRNPQPLFFIIIAGKCAEAIDELKSRAKYLSALLLFIEKHKHMLPRKFVVKRRKIDEFIDATESMIRDYLAVAYHKNNKSVVKFWCNEALKLAKRVDAYLKRNKELCSLHALSQL